MGMGGRAVGVLAFSSLRYAASYLGESFVVEIVAWSKVEGTVLKTGLSTGLHTLDAAETYAGWVPNAIFLLKLDFFTLKTSPSPSYKNR